VYAALDELTKLQKQYAAEIAAARADGCPDDAPALAGLLASHKELRAEIDKLEEEAWHILARYRL